MLADFGPGSIIRRVEGARSGARSMLATAHRKGGLRLTMITQSGQDLNIAADELRGRAASCSARSICPARFAQPQGATGATRSAKRLRQAKLASGEARRSRRRRSTPSRRASTRSSSIRVPQQAAHGGRSRSGAHARSPNSNARSAARTNRSATSSTGARRAVRRTGYVELDALATHRGGARCWPRTFHESDLLVTEIVRDGLLDGVSPADLAGLVSMVVYEHRSSDAPSRSVVLLGVTSGAGGSGSPRSARSCERRSVRSGWPSTAHPIRRSPPSPTRGSRGRGSPRWSPTRS